jgi:hypothetical protein
MIVWTLVSTHDHITSVGAFSSDELAIESVNITYPEDGGYSVRVNRGSNRHVALVYFHDGEAETRIARYEIKRQEVQQKPINI